MLYLPPQAPQRPGFLTCFRGTQPFFSLNRPPSFRFVPSPRGRRRPVTLSFVRPVPVTLPDSSLHLTWD